MWGEGWELRAEADLPLPSPLFPQSPGSRQRGLRSWKLHPRCLFSFSGDQLVW